MTDLPLIECDSLSEVLADEDQCSQLEAALSSFLAGQRWFAQKTDGIAAVSIRDSVELPGELPSCELLLVDVTTQGGVEDCYFVPVSMQVVPRSTSMEECLEADSVIDLIAWIGAEPGPSDARSGIVECSGQTAFWKSLTIALSRSSLNTRNGRVLKLTRTSNSEFETATSLSQMAFAVHGGEQSNSAVTIGDKFFLKLFRRPRVGHNPDAELGVFLTDRTEFQNSPRVEATIDISGADGNRCLALVSEQVSAESDAWTYTLERLKDYWQRLAESPACQQAPSPGESALTEQLIGPFLKDAELLGRRTAEMHSALASHDNDPALAPEPLTRESLLQLVGRLQKEVQATCELLDAAQASVADFGDLPKRISERAGERLGVLSQLDPADAGVINIRCHGDYHLGQVLRTESDFIIIDFEGEPDRSFEERRQKHCAMKDVAGMVRSLHYASNAAAVGLLPEPDLSIVSPAEWQQFWFDRCAERFLSGYADSAAGQAFVPADSELSQGLLDLFLIEKVLYELRYEVNNRPDWIQVPMSGLTAVLGVTALE